MAKYAYLAIFHREEEGGFYIEFPDFDACFTQGEDVPDGLEMAEDVLCLTLYDMEQNGEKPPTASDQKDIKVDEKSFVTLVGCDTVDYEKYYSNKSVKKTLSIPEWLDRLAKKENVNFSGVLQDALMEKLLVERRAGK